MHKLLSDRDRPFTVLNENNHSLPFVISLPHSGQLLTEEMERAIVPGSVLANMDWYLPELYDFLPERGYTVCINNMSRYLIDPNRAPTDADASYSHSLIYSATTFGRPLYLSPLSEAETEQRRLLFYRPYHETLARLIAQKQQHFSRVFLLDLHSFGKELSQDVVLGNRCGETMEEKRFETVSALFSQAGFSPAGNVPFSGGFITRHYGRAGSGCESLQIEISYCAYIAGRSFGEEECPVIDRAVMSACREKLKAVFSGLEDLFLSSGQ